MHKFRVFSIIQQCPHPIPKPRLDLLGFLKDPFRICGDFVEEFICCFEEFPVLPDNIGKNGI